MSFIFDALKKSEDERRRGEVPDLRAEHVLSPAPRPHRQRWPLVLTGALLVNAAILLWWLWPGHQGEQAAVPHVPVASSGPAAVPASAELSVPLPAVQTSAPEFETAAPGKDTDGSGPAAVAPIAPAQTPAPSAASSDRKVPLPPGSENTASAPAGWSDLPANTGPVPAPKPKSKPMSRAGKPGQSTSPLPHLQDLAEDLRRRLPDLDLTLHYYTADPGSRMVRLNGRILRQGGSIGQNLQVEEITPSGLIMNWEGKRFRLGE